MLDASVVLIAGGSDKGADLGVLAQGADHVRAAVVARCAAHVADGGRLIAGFGLSGTPGAVSLDEYDDACRAAGFELDRFSTFAIAGLKSMSFMYAGTAAR